MMLPRFTFYKHLDKTFPNPFEKNTHKLVFQCFCEKKLWSHQCHLYTDDLLTTATCRVVQKKVENLIFILYVMHITNMQKTNVTSIYY